MSLWERLRHFELGWGGLAALAGAFVAFLFLRRMLPDARRHRGRISLLLLGLGPILHLVATGIGLAGGTGVASALHLLNLFLVIVGVAGALSVVLFDVTLGRSDIPTIVRDSSQAVVFGVIVFTVLRSGGFDPVSVLTTSAVATAVVGLALQQVLANLFAGLVLQVERPFRLGDWIQIGARTGKIVEIQWRSSTLQTRDGDYASIPNLQLLVQEVVNLSRPARSRKVSVKVLVHNRHSPEEVEAPMIAAARSIPGILAKPSPSCSPSRFGETHVLYSIGFWVADVKDEPSIASELRRRVWYAAERHGLEGPCPRRRPLNAGAGKFSAQHHDEVLRAQRTRILERVGLFAPLATAEREALALAMQRARFGRGETILREKEPGDSVFVIESGEVEVTVGEARAAVATLGAADFFGEMSLLTGAPRHATCVATRETTTYEIDTDALRGLLALRPALAEELASVLSTREATLAEKRGSGDADLQEKRSDRLFQQMRAYFQLA